MKDSYAIAIIKDELFKYGQAKRAIPEQRKQVEAIENEMEGVKAIVYDKDKVQSSGADETTRIIDLLARKNKLEIDLQRNERLVQDLEPHLNLLEDEEREIITKLWIEKTYQAASWLAGKYSYGRSKVYRISDDVLKRLTKIRWGLN